MAKQLFAESQSKGYTIKIYANTTEASYNPFTFDTSFWTVKYRAEDNYGPGFVGSQMTIQAAINDDDFTANLENILQDSDGIFLMELWEGLSKEWVGFVQPAGGQVEVVNGQRMIKIMASDGFQQFNQTALDYTWTTRKSFLQQFLDVLGKYDYWDIIDGIAISETTQTGTGTAHNYIASTYSANEGHWEKDGVFVSYKKGLSDILTIFGMRMYQCRGHIVLQSIEKAANATYNIYNSGGTLVANVDHTVANTVNVTGGTKLYTPAVKYHDIVLQADTTQLAHTATYEKMRHLVTYWGAAPTYEDGKQVGSTYGDGVVHIDYDMGFKITLSIPPDYSDNLEISFRVYFKYGDKYGDSSSWTTSSKYVEYKESRNVTNSDPVNPSIEVFTHSVNNQHLATTPTDGDFELWVYLEAVQTAGDSIGTLSTPECTYTFTHHGSSGVRTYRADNSKRRMGEHVSLSTNVGTLTGATDEPHAILNAAGSPEFLWATKDDAGVVLEYGPLEWLTAKRLAEFKSQPREYYEITTISNPIMTHMASWGGDTFMPINMEINSDGLCNVTYVKHQQVELLTDPDFRDTEL